jgi:hypothetical protein
MGIIELKLHERLMPLNERFHTAYRPLQLLPRRTQRDSNTSSLGHLETVFHDFEPA